MTIHTIHENGDQTDGLTSIYSEQPVSNGHAHFPPNCTCVVPHFPTC